MYLPKELGKKHLKDPVLYSIQVILYCVGAKGSLMTCPFLLKELQAAAVGGINGINY